MNMVVERTQGGVRCFQVFWQSATMRLEAPCVGETIVGANILKHRLYFEQITGEPPESIHQVIHAKIFTANLAEALKNRLFGWLIQRVPHDQMIELTVIYAKILERQRTA